MGLGTPPGLLLELSGPLWGLPKDKRRARSHHQTRQVLPPQLFLANSQTVSHFSYIFKNAPGRKCAGLRAARRNVGATGEELKEGKGIQKLAILKRSCLDLALSPCLTRRRGGGGSLRAFRRARHGEAKGRVDWKRIRWPDAKFGVTGAKCDLGKEP